MGIAALIAWLVTAGGGFVMLGLWFTGSNRRLSAGLVLGHFALAVVGLVLWIVYLGVGDDALAWLAFALLLVVALLGFTMFTRWLPARRSDIAESRFPLPVVLGHGLVGATTLVLVLLTAIGV